MIVIIGSVLAAAGILAVLLLAAAVWRVSAHGIAWCPYAPFDAHAQLSDIASSLQQIRSDLASLRREVNEMRATNEVVDKLCDAVLAAQQAQAGSEQALADAQQQLADIVAETELTPATTAKVQLILGNAVAAEPPPTE